MNKPAIFRICRILGVFMIAATFAPSAIADMSWQKAKFDDKFAKEHGFFVGYEINHYKNVFITATFPHSIGKHYRASSSLITIKLSSGNTVTFVDSTDGERQEYTTEVDFENESDFIDASISFRYLCRSKDGIICGGRSYTIESIKDWQSDSAL